MENYLKIHIKGQEYCHTYVVTLRYLKLIVIFVRYQYVLCHINKGLVSLLSFWVLNYVAEGKWGMDVSSKQLLHLLQGMFIILSNNILIILSDSSYFNLCPS